MENRRAPARRAWGTFIGHSGPRRCRVDDDDRRHVPPLISLFRSTRGSRNGQGKSTRTTQTRTGKATTGQRAVATGLCRPIFRDGRRCRRNQIIETMAGGCRCPRCDNVVLAAGPCGGGRETAVEQEERQRSGSQLRQPSGVSDSHHEVCRPCGLRPHESQNVALNPQCPMCCLIEARVVDQCRSNILMRRAAWQERRRRGCGIGLWQRCEMSSDGGHNPCQPMYPSPLRRSRMIVSSSSSYPG